MPQNFPGSIQKVIQMDCSNGNSFIKRCTGIFCVLDNKKI